eukprot:TRINITY_DN426_c0_g1_i2.p1 TRINITY_DN426_c0_g1~~TRINITY_DN426_c0_g1_i2.p1  ORF type:complete len:282 (-),score=83.30 TRINITY_DN426_c0_g1_i2:191-1036(-)
MSKLLYADLGKKSTDLLTKDFPDKTKVEINSRTPNGITFQVTGTRNHDGSIIGSVQPKVILAKQATTLSLNVDTNKNAKVEATVEKYPGFKGTITAINETESIKGDLEYKSDRFTFTTGIEALNPKGTTLSASSVVSHEGLSLGVSGEYLIGDKTEFKKADAVLAYTTPELQITGFARSKGSIFGATFFQRVNPDISLAAEFSLDTKKTDVAPKLAVGVSNNFDSQGTQGKIKIDTEGKLWLSYSQILNQRLKFTVGTSINANNLGASGNHQTGVSLVFDF